jgi:hypothetical protein
MKYIPAAVTRTVASTVFKARENSPTLLFVSGVVGVTATTVLACRATLKVEEVLEEHNKMMEKIAFAEGSEVLQKSGKYVADDAHKDRVLVYLKTTGTLVKLYGPAIVCGLVSVGALTQSHRILNNRNAGLVAAYTALEKGFNEYRQRVIDDVGEDRERELRYPLESCEIDDEDKPGKTKQVQRVGAGSASIYARFFDHNSPSWNPQPDYNIVYLRCQQNTLNDQLRSRGHVFLNEVYDALGIERTKEGSVVGWLWEGKGDNYIDFGIFNREMTPERLDFFTGNEGAILLDFNVDGVIYDRI